jgi:ABC-type long-subunit fatty acid transport system fused permease/ATPase subunit
VKFLLLLDIMLGFFGTVILEMFGIRISYLTFFLKQLSVKFQNEVIYNPDNAYE